MHKLADLTLTEVSDLLDRREISATELVEAALFQIEETEKSVQAYTHLLSDEAMVYARKADREIANGDRRGPLHGVPIAVKDIMHIEGVPTEAGSAILAGFVPEYSATVVQRLRAAGAIIIGKTVCHEFAYGVNEPPTRNPWAPDCYPGGSSAGSGVSVAVRSSFGALGSDTGGSIRIPASINGIVGLKPTYGLVSSYGVIPLAWSLDHVGPLTRTVTDNALMLQVIAGEDLNDPTTVGHPSHDYVTDIEAGVDDVRIGVERSYFFYDGLSNGVREAVEQVIAEYDRLGATIVDVEIPEIAAATDLLNTILLVEASTYHQEYLRKQSDDYDPATRMQLELGELIPATHYVAAQRGRAAIRRAVVDKFRKEALDVLLSPTMPLTTVPLNDLHAPRKDYPSETPMQSYVHHTFAANITAQPAISIPCGLSDLGLPIGFQIMGRPFREGQLFQIARAYERATQWSELVPNLARKV